MLNILEYMIIYRNLNLLKIFKELYIEIFLFRKRRGINYFYIIEYIINFKIIIC